MLAGFAAGGPTAALQSFRARFGEILQFRDLTLYPSYVIAEVVNPQRPDEVDRYVLRAGAFDNDPRPVPVSSRECLDDTTFRAAELRWEVLAELAARAPGELQIAGGAVSHLIVERAAPGGRVQLRAYVSTDRRSGTVEADAEGRTTRTFVS